MSGRGARETAAVVGLVGMLLAASAGLLAAREHVYPSTDVDDETLYLTSGTAARSLAVAYQALLADVYWIRAIQYYGGTRRRLGPETETASAEVSAFGLPAGEDRR